MRAAALLNRYRDLWQQVEKCSGIIKHKFTVRPILVSTVSRNFFSFNLPVHKRAVCAGDRSIRNNGSTRCSVSRLHRSSRKVIRSSCRGCPNTIR